MIKIDETGRAQGGGCAAFSIQDRAAHNAANIGLHSAAQIALADKLAPLVAAAHNATSYSPDYNKQWISVKTSTSKLTKRNKAEYAALDKFCTAHGIIEVRRANSTLYHVK